MTTPIRPVAGPVPAPSPVPPPVVPAPPGPPPAAAPQPADPAEEEERLRREFYAWCAGCEGYGSIF